MISGRKIMCQISWKQGPPSRKFCGSQNFLLVGPYFQHIIFRQQLSLSLGQCKCLIVTLDICRAQCGRLREGKLVRMPPGFANCFIWFLNFLSSMGSSQYVRTISQHTDGISRYSVLASAGPLLPLVVGDYRCQCPLVLLLFFPVPVHLPKILATGTIP